MSAVPSGGVIAAWEGWAEPSQGRTATRTDGHRVEVGRGIPGVLPGDSSILRAPGAGRGTTRCCHLCCTSPAAARLQSLDPAEDWWEFCIQEAQTQASVQPPKELQEGCDFVFLSAFWKPVREAQPGCAVGERMASAARAGHHRTCREVAKLEPEEVDSD